MRITKAQNYLGHLTSIWRKKMSTVNQHQQLTIAPTMLTRVKTSLTGRTKNLRNRSPNVSALIWKDQKGLGVIRILILMTKESWKKPLEIYLNNTEMMESYQSPRKSKPFG